jgi:hypothetical protein
VDRAAALVGLVRLAQEIPHQQVHHKEITAVRREPQALHTLALVVVEPVVLVRLVILQQVAVRVVRHQLAQ